MQLNRLILRLLSIWPYAEESSSFLAKLKRFLLILGCYFLLCSELISTILYVTIVEKQTCLKARTVRVVHDIDDSQIQQPGLQHESNKGLPNVREQRLPRRGKCECSRRYDQRDQIRETLASFLWYIYVHFRTVFSHDRAAEQGENRHRAECHD